MSSQRSLWAALGVLALGVGAGVPLGQSAIRDIHPLHFQGAAAPPRAVEPAPPPVPPSAYAQAVSWEQGEAARAADGGYEDFDFAPPPLEPRAAAAEPYWREPEAPPSLAPWPPGRIAPRGEFERDSDLPIERKPAADTAPAWDAPAKVEQGE